MPPLISVIVPAYNIEKYLPKTLDSILAQTYTNLEVIIVNDGSTDNTRNIIDRFCKKDVRIKAIHKSNGGVTSARLEGMKHAKGDWISFIDGDDLIDSDMLERLLKNAEDYHVDISHCGYDMQLPSGKVINYHGTGKIIMQDKMQGLIALLTGKIIEPTLCNKIFSREIIRNFLKDVTLDTSIKNNEDLLMNFYLFKEVNNSVFEDFCPYHYIVRKDSATNAPLNEHQLLDPLRVKRIIAEECPKLPECYHIAENQVITQLVILATMSGKKNQEIQCPIIKAARQELREHLFSVLFSSAYTIKTRLFCIWATIFPPSFRWIHTLYASLKGISHPYEKR